MSFLWSYFRLYAFPPFAMIPSVLEKIAQDGADVALIVPYWPQRPWFPKLLSLLVGIPRALPHQKDLLKQPLSQLIFPSIESLHLSFWILSGYRERRQAFLLEQLSSQQKLSETLHVLLMIPSSSIVLL